MHEMGLNAYRFSISWSRLIPGYSQGVFSPGRCSSLCGNCYMGDSAREPYIVGHNFLLSHASAAALYKEMYQVMQGGKLGITLIGFWFEPLTNLPGDVAAAKRTEEFILGWFLHPLVYGTYPAHMKEVLGSRLPSFAAEESKILKASFDFIGITHYNAMYLGEYNSSTDMRNCFADIYAKLSSSNGLFGKNISEQVQEFPDSSITPWSLKKLLEYIKEKYGNPPLIIHENGYGEFNVNKASSGNSTDDERRAYCLQEYTGALLQTIRNGSNTLGYFVWSFVDCFELAFGYTARYGLYEVDFSRADRRRYPRLSAQWYSNFLRSSSLRTSTSSSSVAHANQS